MTVLVEPCLQWWLIARHFCFNPSCCGPLMLERHNVLSCPIADLAETEAEATFSRIRGAFLLLYQRLFFLHSPLHMSLNRSLPSSLIFWLYLFKKIDTIFGILWWPARVGPFSLSHSIACHHQLALQLEQAQLCRRAWSGVGRTTFLAGLSSARMWASWQRTILICKVLVRGPRM